MLRGESAWYDLIIADSMGSLHPQVSRIVGPKHYRIFIGGGIAKTHRPDLLQNEAAINSRES